MGYESKLIVGKQASFLATDPGHWVWQRATFDLGKLGLNKEFDRLLAMSLDLQIESGEKFWFFADDGDTKITQDRYGDDVLLLGTPVAVLATFDAMGNDLRPDILAFREYLRVMADRDDPTMVVLHYGY